MSTPVVHFRRSVLILVLTGVAVAACTRDGIVEVSATVVGAEAESSATETSTAGTSHPVTSGSAMADAAPSTGAATLAPTALTSTTVTVVQTDPSTAPAVASNTEPAASPASPVAVSAPETLPGGAMVQGVAVPELGSGTTPYRIPTSAETASWADTHHDYPATDIFVPGTNGCGGPVTSPVTGVIVEVRRDNDYDPAVDNPATRGGRSVTIVGDDGVRYYMSHLESIDAGLAAGDRVAVGDDLGTVGTTGRSGACHIHLGISPACPDREWSLRRGVIWPYPYLDDWRSGGNRSPVDEIATYLKENPDACAKAAADPNAADA